MRLTVEYKDHESLTIEEAIAHAKGVHKGAKVSVLPDGNDVDSIIYFGIQQLVTAEQISSFFDDGPVHPVKLELLRKRSLVYLEDVLNRVLVDNEVKLAN